MSAKNHVSLMGNLTRDPETRTVGESSVTNFGIAVNEKYKDKEDTTFVDCECWAKRGEVIAQYFSKGKPILINGTLRLDQWQDKDGSNRSKLKVRVDDFAFVSEGKGGQNESPPAARRRPASDTPMSEDDIPF